MRQRRTKVHRLEEVGKLGDGEDRPGEKKRWTDDKTDVDGEEQKRGRGDRRTGDDRR